MGKQFFLFFLSLSAFTLSCNTNTKINDCNRVKIGKFGFQSALSKRNYLIERKDSIQIETDEETGSIVEFKVNWIDPCEYNLFFNRLIKSGSDTEIIHRHFYPVKTSVLEVGKDFYVFRSRVDSTGVDMVDTMGISKTIK